MPYAERNSTNAPQNTMYQANNSIYLTQNAIYVYAYVRNFDGIRKRPKWIYIYVYIFCKKKISNMYFLHVSKRRILFMFKLKITKQIYRTFNVMVKMSLSTKKYFYIPKPNAYFVIT